MPGFLRTLIHDYGWIHLGLGLVGNALFVIGSVLFLPAFDAWKVLGVWLFILGSTLMLIGAIGSFLVKITKRD
ncbi:YrhK family protein [Croceicoccus mobilis]|uniref:YrhK domain-containing protein n=1 Tax=Croceicoccus mobilis TaxID=1703339 RepID=A0A916YXL9_9SPHN|nr:YrhK family protein [Croceicoccus mobilis]GGD66447.1 hypothetical protein GCM10010990_15000 [Croceicoccus mobilis]